VARLIVTRFSEDRFEIQWVRLPRDMTLHVVIDRDGQNDGSLPIANDCSNKCCLKAHIDRTYRLGRHDSLTLNRLLQEDLEKNPVNPKLCYRQGKARIG
jgi:hypothetical protein